MINVYNQNDGLLAKFQCSDIYVLPNIFLKVLINTQFTQLPSNNAHAHTYVYQQYVMFMIACRKDL